MAASPTESETPSASGTTSVVIADDHAIVRDGLRMLLEAEGDIDVVAEAGDVEGAVRFVRGHRPEVLILDLNMQGQASLPVLPELRRASPRTGIVILTMQSELAFAREALRAGALGYVLKEAAGTELVRAVRGAAAGRTYLQPELGARLATESERAQQAASELTDREIEVLKLIALGYTNREIADQLFLSVRTVESHRAHLQQKLGRGSRAELVRYALERRLLDS